jgi:predicted N-acetyltransferase YhbS
VDVTLRPAAIIDIDACGRIIHEAFTEEATQRGFQSGFPTVEAGVRAARARMAYPSIFAVVAEQAGQVVGSAFMTEGDAIRGVGPITVRPGVQGRGIGRRLMHAVLDRGRDSASMRLIQDATNLVSLSVYASLGFEVKEPLLLMSGSAASPPSNDVIIRQMTEGDLDSCAVLCRGVLGFDRTVDLQQALATMSPMVAVRSGRITAYVSAWPLTLQGHAVAETAEDLGTLLAPAPDEGGASHTFLLPSRQAASLRWCLRESFRAVRPLTLMALGKYQDPLGCYMPSLLY